MNEWIGLIILATIFAGATLIRVRLGPVVPATLGTREAELDELSRRRSVDPYTEFDEAATDGLITIAHLERHLPPELPFRGHTLKRGLIGPWWTRDKASRETRQQYIVLYECDPFFNCNQAPSPFWFECHIKTEPDGTHVRAFTPALPKNSLGGMMLFDRVPPEQLPDAIREQMRALYRHLEHEVEEEARRGCSIRPTPDRAA